MQHELAGSASEAESAPAENGTSSMGLVARLQQRGHDLSRGRRVAIPIPGYEGFAGDERALWARYSPLNRALQQQYAWTPDATAQEADVIAPIIASLCEEILIGTPDERTPLADVPEVRNMRDSIGPLRYDADLGLLLGVGGSDPASVVKRVLIRGDDDLPLYGVWGELLSWSTSVYAVGVETAAGE